MSKLPPRSRRAIRFNLCCDTRHGPEPGGGRQKWGESAEVGEDGCIVTGLGVRIDVDDGCWSCCGKSVGPDNARIVVDAVAEVGSKLLQVPDLLVEGVDAVETFTTPDVARRDEAHVEAGHDAKVVIATLEGFIEIWI